MNGETTTYTWDDRNRLVSSTTADGDVVSYEYDDENIRVSSTVNGTKTTYLVDSNRPYAQVLEEYEDESLKVRYVQGLDLISIERDGEVSVYLVDGLGSTRTLTDLDGEVVATYTYDAFGELLGSTGEVENDYLFAGEQFDGELGQYYLRQRFYDAGVGRFTRRDSWEGRIGEPVTLHKYLYGNGNPVNFTDPSGLFAITEQLSSFEVGSILAGIGAVGIVVTNDPPPPVPFPFPGGGSIPDGPGTFPNNDGILDRILDFGRRMGGFGEGPQPEFEYRETFPGNEFNELVAYVFGIYHIEEGKQGKHIVGHNSYEPERKRSILTHPDPQGLVDEFAGKGQQKGETQVGLPGSKEVFDANRVIGIYVDPISDRQQPTTKGIIHYSKRGVHIVPARP